ncbi:hypothetical protein CH306_02410 [Rhodococcus sp. 15-725-2-2b]|nr:MULTISPECIES: hypothetical protein [unclassified Rhodococcus (in: high G+C Gram-positive bacteria)]OZD48774.1 hypothetical protein CH264_05910 [Rhodococcus sp. 06-1477-1A]OZE77557.1 hypothetical protein CH306_02410 [Rhodococcus sp. 15-725-2-2b]OZC72548.1 hypothetical protein CH277_00685 [Rhodococcus sp. 06-469-3-2]OZE03335.1 hypothetical protein CH250_24475 [Rhodococcus sp. 05-2255-3C]OZE09722.1 hypothetical protein CH249_16405 [Rhodococcus sp. 05-2255-3B1]
MASVLHRRAISPDEAHLSALSGPQRIFTATFTAERCQADVVARTFQSMPSVWSVSLSEIEPVVAA